MLQLNFRILGLVLICLVLSIIIIVGIVHPELLLDVYFDPETNETYVWRDLRLPNHTFPVNYHVSLETYLEPDWKFRGEEEIVVRVSSFLPGL